MPVASVTLGSVPRLPLTGPCTATFAPRVGPGPTTGFASGPGPNRRHNRIGSVMSNHNSNTMNTSNIAMTGIATAATARGSTV